MTENDTPANRSFKVTVIIPSLHPDPENLDSLRETILEAGFRNGQVQILAAVGVRPNGRARDVGVLDARGEYLIFMDDDVTFPRPGDLKSLVDFLENHPEVGLVGPAQQLPPDLSEIERQRALQLPRSHVESPEEFHECDMVTHACMALRRENFLRVGMEHPNLISGTDPDLRNRIRKSGKKVGIVPGTRVYHPPITSWSDVLRKNFRGGRRSRAVLRDYPQYHLPAEPEISSQDETVCEDSLSRKLRNHLTRLGKGITSGNLWWLSAQLSYLLGYGFETISPERKVEPIPYPDDPGPGSPGWDEFLEALRTEGEVLCLHPNEESPPQ